MKYELLNKEPWLNNNGKEKSSFQLRTESRNWDADTWDRYLGYLKHRNKPLKGRELFEKNLNRLVNISPNSPLFDLVDSTTDYHWLEHVIRKTLPTLSDRQRKAFELRYWHSMTISEIAKRMALNRGSVCNHLKRAELKIIEANERVLKL